MTLTYVICILGVPIAGIAAIGAALARQFILRNREFVRLAGLDDEFAPIALPNDARNRTPEMTVTETVENNLHEAIERLTELRSTGQASVCLGRFAMHCATEPSCP